MPWLRVCVVVEFGVESLVTCNTMVEAAVLVVGVFARGFALSITFATNK